MNKILFIFMSIIFLNAQDYEDIYIKFGPDEVIKNIEKNITSQDFWLKKLENKDLKYGYYDKDIDLIIVDKIAKNLNVFSYDDGKLQSEFESEVLVGKVGQKLVEGDLKTPIGVYELTRRFTPQDRYLGPLAFSLSYPNLLDKASKRNGSGIWIHGYPLDGYREDTLKTKGCVAIKNDILFKFDEVINHKKSLAIIYEDNKVQATTDEIALIFANLFKWKKAWQDNLTDEYLDFYDKDFRRYDGLKLDKFKSNKRSIFAKKEKKKIYFSDFLISPYPNAKNNKIFRISFYEKYFSNSYKFNGQKTLYVKLVKNEMKILVEE